MSENWLSSVQPPPAVTVVESNAPVPATTVISNSLFAVVVTLPVDGLVLVPVAPPETSFPEGVPWMLSCTVAGDAGLLRVTLFGLVHEVPDPELTPVPVNCPKLNVPVLLLGAPTNNWCDPGEVSIEAIACAPPVIEAKGDHTGWGSPLTLAPTWLGLTLNQPVK